MPPKQPPTLKPISSDSDSSSEDNESQPEIKQNTKHITEIDDKKLTTKKSHIIESDSDSESDNETKKETKNKEKKVKSDNETKKEKKVKPDNNKLLADINIEREQILKRLSELQKSENDIIKNKEKKSREPQKPLDKKKIPECIKKFIKCNKDAEFTRMDLSQEIRKQLIPNGKEQLITKKNLHELNINEEARKELELEEVNKEELKEDIAKQLTDKNEKYYRVKFGKLLSIVSYLVK
jgi:hypothetical protein